MKSKENRERKITFAQAINEAMHQSMREDSSVICFGLGVTDPAGIFGTTLGLEKQYGSHRVFDIPTSENAMTGVAVGAAIAGLKPVLTHQRFDFFLLAMDQLVNSAAKWHFMFGGQFNVPITIRLIIGRGWGQGPTHSQNLQAWFSHIPGLKVVVPSTPSDAKNLLLASIEDPNPVIFIEHRWLHNVVDNVEQIGVKGDISKARVVRSGNQITIISSGYLTIEALEASSYLLESGIRCEVIDMRSLNPIDWQTIFTSVEKTGRLLALDSASITGSISGEIIAKVCSEKFDFLKMAPQRIGQPDVPEPTSFGLTRDFHINRKSIILKVIEMLNVSGKQINTGLEGILFHDVPGTDFKGPF
jgi:pyruvate dehydrogenase E1 component beta subunit